MELGVFPGARRGARFLGPVAQGRHDPDADDRDEPPDVREPGQGVQTIRGQVDRLLVAALPGLAGQDLANPLATHWRHPPDDRHLVRLRLLDRPQSRSDRHLARDVSSARLALDRPLDPLVDRQAGGEHERAEDHAQGRQECLQLLLAERGQGQDNHVDPAHEAISLSFPIAVTVPRPRSAHRPAGQRGRCGSRPVPRRG